MRVSLILLLSLFYAGFLPAQEQVTRPFSFAITHQLESVILSETRTLNIYLPEGYHPDSAMSYPVIYLLDGSAHEDFPHIAGLVQFLSFPWINVVSPSIVVGIANVDRQRDFTHPTTDTVDLRYVPTGGGSASFISFLEKELQPYINACYRTTDQKTIIGQSLGGLLATEILVKKPELFNRYIIVSPSLWWDHSSLLSEVPVFLEAHPDLSAQVCIAIGNEGKEMNVPVKKLVAYLKKGAPEKLQWEYVYMPDEDHATSLHLGAYRAFQVFHEQEQQ